MMFEVKMNGPVIHIRVIRDAADRDVHLLVGSIFQQLAQCLATIKKPGLAACFDQDMITICLDNIPFVGGRYVFAISYTKYNRTCIFCRAHRQIIQCAGEHGPGGAAF